ncbi:hypothetical protein [Leeuwenhoekiella sp. NPDC079379]|uniref:hypothetical protein n=1 Tax=Leeuwenhoekiella sp. NPDC079379 TaxID=3364122 RepID=UPI0037C70955
MSIPKDYKEFEITLTRDNPPPDWPETLQSLWYKANDNWEASHTIAQDIKHSMGSLIHAHLHRDEGDNYNAKYWYTKAGRAFPNISLKEELRLLIAEIISSS